jgi:hypothetical protein
MARAVGGRWRQAAKRRCGTSAFDRAASSFNSEKVRAARMSFGARKSTLTRLHNPPLTHQRDAIAHAHGLLGVMGDDDRGGARLMQDGERLFAHLLAEARVEPRERLIHEQHARARRDRARERHALLLAAGENMRILAPHHRRGRRARARRRPAASFASAVGRGDSIGNAEMEEREV